ncbi:MAG: lytic murein transglycosylase B [Gammaproteobacteria bacterium]
MRRLLILLTLLMLATPALAQANYSERDDVRNFVNDMVKKHRFDEQMLMYWMNSVEQQKTALKAIARPAEGKPWKDYRPIFITNKRITRGVEFWRKHNDVLSQAEQRYGVPAEIIVAIIGVETFYGKRSGSYPVLDALTTLGFDYPPRAAFFRKELEQFLLMSREERFDPTTLKGSYAGAMGMPQFISSSFRSYAVDFDGDGRRDLWGSTADAIGSVANYFSRHGWRNGAPIISRAQVSESARSLASKRMRPEKSIAEYKQVGVVPLTNFNDNESAILLGLEGKNGQEYWLGLNNFYVITRYNHSPLYAMAVYQLGQALATNYYGVSRDK